MASWLPKTTTASKALGAVATKVALPIAVAQGIFGNAGKAGMSQQEEDALIARDSAGPTGNIQTPVASSPTGDGGSSTGGGTQTPLSGGSGTTNALPGIGLGGVTTNKRDDLMRLQNMQQADINAEFEDELKRLGKVKSGVEDRYNEASGLLASYFPQFENLVNQEKTNQMTTLGNLEIQRTNESNNALAQARQLLGDLQRRQGAYLSASGNYGSSVPEALGEQFGRQAFSSIGNVQKQRDAAMADIASKKAAAETFYSNKLLAAKQEYDQQQMNLRQQFEAQLDAIDNAKGAASSAKRAATTDAWKEYVNAKLTLDNNAKQTTEALTTWANNLVSDFKAKEAELDQSSQNVPGINQALTIDDINAGFASGGLTSAQNMQNTSQYSPIYRTGAKDDLMSQILGGQA